MRLGIKVPKILPLSGISRRASCSLWHYCCRSRKCGFFHLEQTMNASNNATRHCFLPLLTDPAVTDRDEDATTSPLAQRKLRDTFIQSKIRQRSSYPVSPVPLWKSRRRPRVASCSGHEDTRLGPGTQPTLVNDPRRTSQPVDLAAVLAACADCSVPPGNLPPLNILSNASKGSPTRAETVRIGVSLPPLELRVLQRPRLFLSTDGFNCSPFGGSVPTVGVEEIIQIEEQSSVKSPPRSHLDSALRLAMLPKKCVHVDEVALMPCHSLGHRGFPELAAELWREPTRDRDKDWQQDELALILAGADRFAARRRRGLGMTVAPSPANRGKWRRWEAQKLQLKTCEEASTSPSSPIRRRRRQTDGVLLHNYGAMISKTYCLMSVYGVGLVGRLYDAGVSQREQLSAESINAAMLGDPGCDSAEESTPQAVSDVLHQQRYLRVEAYDPGTSRVFSLRVTLGDLSWAFHNRPELLVAGRKLALLRELISLLFFEYPAEEDAKDQPADCHSLEPSSFATPQGPYSNLEPGTDQKLVIREPNVKLPVLRLAQERRVSEAARRRMEREARLRWEEEQRLLALAAFLKLPRRARHRLACKSIRLNGRIFIVSVYHLPAQVRSFVVVVYHPRSSTSFHLVVGVTEVAALAKVIALPHTWSTDQRRSLAESVVPRLRFRGSRTLFLPVTGGGSPKHEANAYSDYRAALSIQEDRHGQLAPPGWLPPLEGLRTDEIVRAELAEKRQRDERSALELTASKERDRVRLGADQQATALEKRISELETRRVALLERDAELVKQIEEIDSRGSGVGVTTEPQPSDSGGVSTSKVHHELRRAHKAARKALKAELKTLNAQTADRKRELQLVREQAQLDLDKLQRRLKRKLKALSDHDAIANAACSRPSTVASNGDDVDQSTSSCRISQSRRDPVRGQRTWLARGLIRGGDAALVASGACTVEGSRLRYSVFALDNAEASGITSTFRLELYENVSNQCVGMEISRLEWLALTKATSHEQQLQIPELAIATSSVFLRVQELNVQLADLQREIASLMSSLSAPGQDKSSRKASTVVSKMEGRRRDLEASYAALSHERRRYSRLAPWSAVVRGLCDRLRLVWEPSTSLLKRVELDRCLFRAILPIISLTNDDEDESEATEEAPSVERKPSTPVLSAAARRSSTTTGTDDGQVIYCNIRAVLNREVLEFEVFEPLGRQTWRLTYPDSLELVKEFASNTFMEQQLHVEAIAMTMIFFVSSRTGQAELRFED